MSLPTRERGLKLDIDGKETTIRKIVAPYAGAWIEMPHVALLALCTRCRSLRGSVD